MTRLSLRRYSARAAAVILSGLVLLGAAGCGSAPVARPSLAESPAAISQPPSPSPATPSPTAPSPAAPSPTTAAPANPAPTTPGAFDNLSLAAQRALLAAWIENPKGSYRFYTGDPSRVMVVNNGANGLNNSGTTTPSEVLANSVMFQTNADGTISMMLADPHQTGLNMMENPYPTVVWIPKETLTKAEIVDRYSAAAQQALDQIESVSPVAYPS